MKVVLRSQSWWCWGVVVILCIIHSLNEVNLTVVWCKIIQPVLVDHFVVTSGINEVSVKGAVHMWWYQIIILTVNNMRHFHEHANTYRHALAQTTYCNHSNVTWAFLHFLLGFPPINKQPTNTVLKIQSM